jgi:outer membrane receptor protein involved in Fe transport
MRLVPNWSLTYDPQDYTTWNYSAGMLAKYRYDFDAMRTRLIVGVDADYSPGGQTENRLTATRVGSIFTQAAPGPLVYDYAVTYYGISPYVQLETSPAPRMRVSAGVRYDHSGYTYDNHLTPLATGRWRRPADTSLTYGHLSPKIGVTYEFSSAVNVFVAYRHGFRTPSQGQLFRQGSSANTVGLQPVRADNVEIGVRGRVGGRLDYDISVYRLIKSDDILSYTRPDGSTESQNAGSTSHQGVEVAAGFQFAPPLRLDAAWTLARHEYESWAPGATVDYSGREMANGPRQMGNATLTIAPPALNGAQASVQWMTIGGYWQDPANTSRYDGHHLINARATVPVAGRLTISARVMNLLDTRYAETSTYTIARGLELAPGMPRTVYAGIQYDFRW